MNYRKLYFKLIRHARERQMRFISENHLSLSDVLGNTGINQFYGNFYERHHIIPRSFSDRPTSMDRLNNYVMLTPREHFIAHLLLVKITYKRSQQFPNNANKQAAFKKMSYAIVAMNNRSNNQNDLLLSKKMADMDVVSNQSPSYLYQVAKNNILSNGVLKTYSPEQVKVMFDYYYQHGFNLRSRSRRQSPDYIQFQKKFDYPYSRKQLNKLFARDGLSIQNTLVNDKAIMIDKFVKQAKMQYVETKKSKRKGSRVVYSFDQVANMFRFFVKHNNCIQDHQYHSLQQKFNYQPNRHMLLKLFSNHGLSCMKFETFCALNA